MNFDLSIPIDRPPAAAFAFPRDKNQHAVNPGSRVLILAFTTQHPDKVLRLIREATAILIT